MKFTKNKLINKFFNFKNEVVLFAGCYRQITNFLVNLFINFNSKVQEFDIKTMYKKRVPTNGIENIVDLLIAIIYLSSDYSYYTMDQNIVLDARLSLT